MRKNLYTKFSTRQYMLSRDFEIYYYGDPYNKKVESTDIMSSTSF